MYCNEIKGEWNQPSLNIVYLANFALLGNRLQKWEYHLKGYFSLVNCAPPAKLTI